VGGRRYCTCGDPVNHAGEDVRAIEARIEGWARNAGPAKTIAEWGQAHAATARDFRGVAPDSPAICIVGGERPGVPAQKRRLYIISTAQGSVPAIGTTFGRESRLEVGVCPAAVRRCWS
jgi:hypothetical protein